MLVKIENGIPVQWPVSEAHVQATNPRTSFAMPIDEATLYQFGYATLHFSDPATYDAEWQEVVEIPPEQVDGKWTQQWDIIEKYTAEDRAIKEAEKAAQQAELAATQYQRQRAAEYPPMTDYIDGIVKGDQAQVQAYIDACLAVKAKYPKP
jgi:hypothetical protein